MKARSSLVLMVVFACSFAEAVIPGNKRTIFTSGEKVYPIRYQLGQSTVIDLGVKPEVVICGNKNYFNIEKLKSAITIQPLSNFSTNLTVLSGQKRFLFYLIPASGQSPDGFVDVKWVSSNDQKTVSTFSKKADSQIELNQVIRLSLDIELTIVRVKASSESGRRIFDILVKNNDNKIFALKEINLTAFDGHTVIKNQALVWEKDTVDQKTTIAGRLIITTLKTRDLTMQIKLGEKTLRFKIKGAKN